MAKEEPMTDSVFALLQSLKESGLIQDHKVRFSSFGIEAFLEVAILDEKSEGYDIQWILQNLKPDKSQRQVLLQLEKAAQEGWLDYEILDEKAFKQRKLEQNPGACWTWLAGLQKLLPSPEIASAKPRSIHFYGYKGGQGRSAVLAQFAKELALQLRHRVLIVDLDIEAPSQHLIFQRNASVAHSTIFEFLNEKGRFYSAQSLPLEVLPTSFVRSGIYLLAAQIDEESISQKLKFIQSMSTNPALFKIAMERIREYTLKADFDMILFDHSTGLNPLCLPTIQVFPGDGVLFCKLDQQWQEAKKSLNILVKQLHRVAVVSFDQHNQSEASRKSRSDYEEQIGELENMIFKNSEDGLNFKKENEEDEAQFSLYDVENFHYFWEYNDSYKDALLPKIVAQKSKSLRMIQALAQYFDLRLLDGAEKRGHAAGNKDQTTLVVTKAIEELLSRNNENLFLIGRKGVGKTKIIQYLSERSLGFAFLVDNDDNSYACGFPVSWPKLRESVNQHKDNPDLFWWKLFYAAIATNSHSTSDLKKTFESLDDKSGVDYFGQFENIAMSPILQDRKVFLLDSLETLFDVDIRQKFINSLFIVLRNLDRFDSVGFRVFLRPDMAALAENSEQIMDGRKIDLQWYENEALAFLLHRIISLHISEGIAWVKERFEELQKDKNVFELQEAMLKIFDNTIKVRGSPGVTKFFASYFSDEAPEKDSGATFNPRMIHFFAENLKQSIKSAKSEFEMIPSDLVVKAYREAAKSYIQGVIEELVGMTKRADRSRIQFMLEAMKGQPTPFKEENLRQVLLENCGKGYENDIFELFENMKRLGLLTNSGKGISSHKRVSRLLREALGMKINPSLGSNVR